MPTSNQLLMLLNLQRNLLFTTFLKTVPLAQLLESRAIVRNSPTIKDVISLFHTYIAFCNFYAKNHLPTTNSTDYWDSLSLISGPRSWTSCPTWDSVASLPPSLCYNFLSLPCLLPHLDSPTPLLLLCSIPYSH